MHEPQDQQLSEFTESQSAMRDAIEENGRLIRDNERIIDEHRRYWRKDRPERSS